MRLTEREVTELGGFIKQGFVYIGEDVYKIIRFEFKPEVMVLRKWEGDNATRQRKEAGI